MGFMALDGTIINLNKVIVAKYRETTHEAMFWMEGDPEPVEISASHEEWDGIVSFLAGVPIPPIRETKTKACSLFHRKVGNK